MSQSDSGVHMVRIGPPSSGDVIHRSDCHYLARAKGKPGRWLWADRKGWANIDWQAMQRHGLKPCQWCHPEGMR